MPKSKKTRGRPREPAEETRTVAMTVRMTSAEHEALREKARENSRSLADYLVITCLGSRF